MEAPFSPDIIASSPPPPCCAGKDDNRAMAMTLTTDLINEWLMPVKTLQPENYKFCTVGTGQPLFVMGQRKE